MHAGRIGRAQECTEVVRVLELVEQDEERRLSLRLRRLEDVLELGIGDGRDVGEHALMAVAAGERLDLRALHVLHDDTALFGERRDLCHGALAVAARDPELVDAAARLQRLCHGIAPDEHVIGQFARLLAALRFCLCLRPLMTRSFLLEFPATPLLRARLSLLFHLNPFL